MPSDRVIDQLDRVTLGRLVEATASRSALSNFASRGEQLGAAGPAAVDAERLGVDVLAGERPLGAGLTEDVVLLRAELGPPLLLQVVVDCGTLVSLPCPQNTHGGRVFRAVRPPVG